MTIRRGWDRQLAEGERRDPIPEILKTLFGGKREYDLQISASLQNLVGRWKCCSLI